MGAASSLDCQSIQSQNLSLLQKNFWWVILSLRYIYFLKMLHVLYITNKLFLADVLSKVVFISSIRYHDHAGYKWHFLSKLTDYVEEGFQYYYIFLSSFLSSSTSFENSKQCTLEFSIYCSLSCLNILCSLSMKYMLYFMF